MPPKRAFRNSKSVEQERNVSDLLGPPRDVVDVVDVPDLDWITKLGMKNYVTWQCPVKYFI